MKTTKTWLIVWGWYSNPSMLIREEFTSKRDAWTRVQAIMALRCAPWDGAEERSPCVLEVWTDRDDSPRGSDVAKFSRYEAGSGFCKWGQWGVYNSKTSGEYFG